jgi:menaquinone-dependent protoporphyrinogen oxidase
MKLLIGYASTEGHTRKIARHVADRLVDQGHGVELVPLGDAEDLDPGRFDRAILAASVHIGHYQSALARFVTAHRDWLAAQDTLFLSVSLAAAGHDAEDWRALDKIMADFEEATGWTPGTVLQIAGAYTPSRYDLVRRLIMKRIVAKKDPGIDTSADKDYTDWAALDAGVADWLAGGGASA